MIFGETAIAGAFVIDVERSEDERGFFARTFCEDEMRAHGLNARVVQCNVSWNRKRGTLRGMHYQAAPHEETKIVRCPRGAIWDVIADLRPDSKTYRHWIAIELNAGNARALYIPHGVAHGFITLTDDAEVHYLMGSAFVQEASRGIAWDDPALEIRWPMEPVVISERDRGYARLPL